MHSLIYRAGRKPVSRAPICNASGFIANSNKTVVFEIARLLKPRCPSTIIGAISFGTFNSIKAFFLAKRIRFFTPFYEFLWSVSPFFAHVNSQCSVKPISRLGLFVASANHVVPLFVETIKPHTVSPSRCVTFVAFRMAKSCTPTGFNVSRRKLVRQAKNCVPTIAQTL